MPESLSVGYIYSLAAGQEMNRAVALHVYGFDGTRTPKRDEWEWWGVGGDGGEYPRLPNFSQNREDALILLDRYGFSLGQSVAHAGGGRSYYVGFDAVGGNWRRHDSTAIASELPLAVCRAALLYVMFGQPRPPSGLRIVVTTHAEDCFHVSFTSPEKAAFDAAVEWLKRTVNARQRSYDKEGKTWNFHPAARAAFEGWLRVCVRELGAEVHYNNEAKGPPHGGR